MTEVKKSGLFFLIKQGKREDQSFMRSITGIKKLLRSQKSFEYSDVDIVKLCSDLSFRLSADGIGTLFILPQSQYATGCQGFFGPLPSAFLDKKF
jgi:hypothetical protein